MPQDHSNDRKVGHAARVRSTLLRAALGVVFIGLVMGLHSTMARAGDDSDSNESFFSKFMRTIGVKRSAVDTSGIQYTERPPLVVPPTRDLPPPASGPPPAADWPQDPAQLHKRAKAKSGVVPGTAVQTPNPPFEKKPWYNPTGWFNKEEYGTFAGEPVRTDLTDPPAGYRIPSPDQPYGIGPDKKEAKVKKAGDGTEVQTGK